LGVIFLIIFTCSVINLNFASSKINYNQIDVDYPKEVYFNKEFEIKIKFNDFDISGYEIKIDITDKNGKRLSRIFNELNNKYQSTNYYIKDIKENPNTFKIIISENYNGLSNLFITLRDRNNKKTKLGPYIIRISEMSNENSQLTDNQIKMNIIDLRPEVTKSIKSNSDNEILFKSKNQIIKEKTIYFFLFFCLIIIIYIKKH